MLAQIEIDASLAKLCSKSSNQIVWLLIANLIIMQSNKERNNIKVVVKSVVKSVVTTGICWFDIIKNSKYSIILSLKWVVSGFFFFWMILFNNHPRRTATNWLFIYSSVV